MSEFRADLHCHSTCSDGSLTPEEILLLGKEIGLSALSITDHDTVEAYATAIPLSTQIGLRLISGVEFSAYWNNVSVHILGYGFLVDHPAIHAFCQTHAKRRLERNLAILDKLTQKGMPLTYEEVLTIVTRSRKAIEKKTIGRPHIALAMVEKGYVDSIQKAFKLYLGEECPCYVQGTPIDAETTINLIHEAKGLAVIAHPHLIRNEPVLKALLKLNFDGIECYYGSHNTGSNERWIKIAKTKGWLMTGGSDYHGINRPDERLGSSWIDEAAFNALLARIPT